MANKRCRADFFCPRYVFALVIRRPHGTPRPSPAAASAAEPGVPAFRPPRLHLLSRRAWRDCRASSSSSEASSLLAHLDADICLPRGLGSRSVSSGRMISSPISAVVNCSSSSAPASAASAGSVMVGVLCLASASGLAGRVTAVAEASGALSGAFDEALWLTSSPSSQSPSSSTEAPSSPSSD